MNKKLIGILMAMCLVTTPILANQHIKEDKVPEIAICPPMLGPITINGQSFYYQDAYPQEDTIMIPIREAATALGFKVKWNGKDQSILLDNGKVETTLVLNKNSYLVESDQAVGLTQAKPLAAAPTLRNNKVYVPVEIFNLLFSNPDAVQKQPDINIKKTTVKVEGKDYTLSVKLPDYISSYIELQQENIEFNQKETYPLILLKFQNKDKVANVGHFSILTTDQFNRIQAEEGPKEQVIIRNDEAGIVITFVGLFDMPFELNTLEAELVGKYHSEIKTILETVRFQ